MERLPVDDVLPELLTALGEGNSAVLSAPPGAGKTTRVPLALLDAPWLRGRVLMLEPRRVAARAAAERLAAGLGEAVGESVGYRIRGEARPGRRIEVVTEGILTRMLQSDPELPGIGAIIFDEVHERSIHSDLGLALALEVQEALRPELRLLAMSATLDVEGFARLMSGAPIIESEGRAYPVETRWLERSWRRPGEGRRFYVDTATALIRRAWKETAKGDLLAFLPGAGEIGRVAARLRTDAPEMKMAELHGSLPFRRQREVLERGAGQRRVVLATSIAETSLTVPGVRVVVDTGLARRSRTDAGTGLARLVTVPVSRAEADQRRGRAGRLAPGICYRMWTKGEEGGLPLFAPPEILEADLAPLVLELGLWGAAPAALRWLDPPPDSGLSAAQALLRALDALDRDNRITAHGRAMAERPLHPRLAHMVLCAEMDGMEGEAALLAALLQERDPLRGAGSDLGLRLRALSTRSGDPRADKTVPARIRAEARRIAGRSGRRDGAAMMTERNEFEAVDGAAPPGVMPSTAEKIAHSPAGQKAAPRQSGTAPPGAMAAHAGQLAALAYPDRIALRRPGGEPRFLLSNGRGAVLDAADPLAGERLLVAVDVTDGTEARIRLAAPITEGEL
ncbi:MAG TPA: ATP-dependent helicase HrpB, partial [Paracoccaceae bacterium]|nr:ATP-dependent helicase HrpB [Paracoccaceae bacterium]